jgi:hypothetical protein
MNRVQFPLTEVDLIGQLADLKEDHYKNILVLSALIDLLIEQGFVTREELTRKALELDAEVGI